MNLNIFSDLRKPGLVPGESLPLSTNINSVLEKNQICNIRYDFPSNYTTQITTLTNYCLYTCCHKTDIPRSQCIIFKESKYNFGNTVVLEALTDSQFLHPWNTFARNVIKIY